MNCECGREKKFTLALTLTLPIHRRSRVDMHDDSVIFEVAISNRYVRFTGFAPSISFVQMILRIRSPRSVVSHMGGSGAVLGLEVSKDKDPGSTAIMQGRSRR